MSKSRTIAITLAAIFLVSGAFASLASARVEALPDAVLVPALTAPYGQRSMLTVVMESVQDGFEVKHEDGATSIALYRPDGERYSVLTINQELGPVVKGLVAVTPRRETAAPPPAADSSEGPSIATFIDSGWTCYDQACARVTGDTDKKLITHYMSVHQWAPTAEYWLEGCVEGLGCGSIGAASITHFYGDAYAEVSKCQDYTHYSLGSKDVWSANYRNKYGVSFGSASRLQIQTAYVIQISGDWTGC